MDKIHKSLYHGELDLGGYKISCAVLDDGTRVLVNRSLSNVLGIKGGGVYWKKKKEGGALLPEYLSAKYLEPFISEETKQKLLEPIVYINNAGVLTDGVPAEFLADICDIYIKAGEKGAFKNNISIPQTAYNLLLSFSKVGIIALVDEVTGYQHEREHDELQKILKAYISEELLPWQKRFPDIYYKELFRLNKWDYSVKGIKQRPSVIGRWTNTLIYEQLPKGVLEELKRKTPVSEKGNKTARYHQYLTIDLGEPNLTAQIHQVITIFQLSDNMEQMWSQFYRLKQRQQGQLSLPFEFDENGYTIEPKEKKEEPKLSDFDQKLTKALNFNPKDKEPSK